MCSRQWRFMHSSAHRNFFDLCILFSFSFRSALFAVHLKKSRRLVTSVIITNSSRHLISSFFHFFSLCSSTLFSFFFFSSTALWDSISLWTSSLDSNVCILHIDEKRTENRKVLKMKSSVIWSRMKHLDWCHLLVWKSTSESFKNCI